MIQQGVRFWFAIALACFTGHAATNAARQVSSRSDANVVLEGATVLSGHSRGG